MPIVEHPEHKFYFAVDALTPTVLIEECLLALANKRVDLSQGDTEITRIMSQQRAFIKAKEAFKKDGHAQIARDAFLNGLRELSTLYDLFLANNRRADLTVRNAVSLAFYRHHVESEIKESEFDIGGVLRVCKRNFKTPVFDFTLKDIFRNQLPAGITASGKDGVVKYSFSMGGIEVSQD